MSQKVWTKEDVDFLLNNLDTSIKYLAEQLGVSYQAIQAKCARLGVKVKRENPLYTPEEDEYIIKHANYQEYSEIAKHLGRTTSGVIGRADRLKEKGLLENTAELWKKH